MIPWLSHSVQSEVGAIEFADDLGKYLKKRLSYTLTTQALCSQFSGSGEIKDARALAEQGKSSEAVSALGDHFIFRVQPKAITQHSDLNVLRPKLRKLDVAYIKGVIEAANLIVEHRISVGGHPPFHFTRGIDWFSDLQGNSWPRLPIEEIQQRQRENEPLSPDPMGDIADTWELNRHDYFLTLGRAYWLSGDENYAAEFIVQAIKWCQDNPPLLGVNWCDHQTVATRLVNWLLALGMFIESPQLQPSQMTLFVETLLNHGALLAHWLSHGVSPSLPMVVGLSMLADWMPEANCSRHWQAVATKSWDEALKSEFNEDRFHRSTSPMRQMISCEWLLLLALQRRASQQRLSAQLDEVLNDVLDSLQCLLEPHNRLSTWGGIPHSAGFMGHGCTAAEHLRNLLALGALLTHRAELYQNLPANPSELLWWVGENGWTDLKNLSQQYSPSTAYLFSETGMGVARSDWGSKATNCVYRATSVSTVCAPSSLNSVGNALPAFHNDALSLSLTIEGEPCILEPGLARDLTKHDIRLSLLSAHSAPRISNELEPPVSDAQLMTLGLNPAEVPPAIYCSKMVGQRPTQHIQFGARRYAYCPDGSKVTITRHIIFNSNDKILIIRDKLEGEGEVPYECNFLLAPHLYLMMRGDMGCRLLGNKLNARIIPHLPPKAVYAKFKGHVSPFLGWHYNDQGLLQPANYLSYRHGRVSLPNNVYFVIHWDRQEAELPKPEDIDRLIGT